MSIWYTELATIAQTTNGETENGLSDTYNDYHDYTVCLAIISDVVQLTDKSFRSIGNPTPSLGSSTAKMSAQSKHRVQRMVV